MAGSGEEGSGSAVSVCPLNRDERREQGGESPGDLQQRGIAPRGGGAR